MWSFEALPGIVTSCPLLLVGFSVKQLLVIYTAGRAPALDWSNWNITSITSPDFDFPAGGDAGRPYLEGQ